MKNKRNETVLMAYAEKLLELYSLEDILEQADLEPVDALVVLMKAGYLVSRQDTHYDLLEEAESNNG